MTRASQAGRVTSTWLPRLQLARRLVPPALRLMPAVQSSFRRRRTQGAAVVFSEVARRQVGALPSDTRASLVNLAKDSPPTSLPAADAHRERERLAPMRQEVERLVQVALMQPAEVQQVLVAPMQREAAERQAVLMQRGAVEVGLVVQRRRTKPRFPRDALAQVAASMSSQVTAFFTR